MTTRKKMITTVQVIMKEEKIVKSAAKIPIILLILIRINNHNFLSQKIIRLINCNKIKILVVILACNF